MLSPVDTAVICGLALLLFGPKKLPEFGRSLGLTLGNFKKALTEAQDEVKSAVKTEEQTPKPVEEEHKSG
jgi:sec-independent protein translocase protein TatA